MHHGASALADREADQQFRRLVSGDPAARERLIAHYTPFAQRLARRYRSRTASAEDLAQTALVGLIKAVDRFDPAHGMTFEGFAVPTILGEVRRYFRDATWDVHVSRRFQEDALALERARDRLQTRRQSDVSLREIAHELGWSLERTVEAARAWSAYDASSLDAPPRRSAGEDDEPMGEAVGALDGSYDAAEYGVCMREAAAGLTDRDRDVLRMRFVEDLSQAEIGARIGVSQMQVSRILRRILDRMRAAADENVGAALAAG